MIKLIIKIFIDPYNINIKKIVIRKNAVIYIYYNLNKKLQKIFRKFFLIFLIT